MTQLDSDGQPYSLINMPLRRDRALHELLGLARGMILDGVVSEREADGLRKWAFRNTDLHVGFPGRELFERLDAIYRDGRVDEHEREELLWFLESLAGESESSAAPESPATATLPLDNPAPIVTHEGSVFVISGRFLCGSRAVVTERLEQKGALVEKSLTQRTNYLLLGSLASRDWKHSSFGRKIEKAVAYRERGLAVAIIAEDHWLSQPL